ncbi:PE family protein [Nocardia sp. BMG111209]|uniref:PE family protein n=1 Tax=Nocardia sp. BMG111209 TaxID=1160137 RepID=UPI00037F0C2A|nr:PE domain-containing protein [Nocardia sp. BMG111209]
MEFDPVRADRAAADLDALADRLDVDLRVRRPALAVSAPGTDEVSRRAALTLSEVAADYGDRAASGVLELRKLAATLRAQSRSLAGMESDNAAALGALS